MTLKRHKILKQENQNPQLRNKLCKKHKIAQNGKDGFEIL